MFLSYASPHGHTLVDGRLYLHRSWLDDPAKRNSPRAAVPAGVGFKTKLELAAEMLQAAAERGQLPYQWVTADAAYGDSHDLRALIAGLGRWYCLEVSRDTEVWSEAPHWQVPSAAGQRGRPRTRARPTAGSPPAAGGRRQHQPAARHGLDSTPRDGGGQGAARVRVRAPARD